MSDIGVIRIRNVSAHCRILFGGIIGLFVIGSVLTIAAEQGRAKGRQNQPDLSPEDRRKLYLLYSEAMDDWQSKRIPEAVSKFQQSYEMRAQVLGPHHEETLTTLIELVKIQLWEGDRKKGEELVDMMVQSSGKNPKAFADATGHGIWQLVQSEPYPLKVKVQTALVEALKVSRGKMSSRTLDETMMLVQVYGDAGKHQAASEVLDQLITATAKAKGKDHPQTQHLVDWQARSYQEQGKTNQATKLLVGLLVQQKGLFPDRSPAITRTVERLFEIFDARGDQKSITHLIEDVNALFAGLGKRATFESLREQYRYGSLLRKKQGLSMAKSILTSTLAATLELPEGDRAPPRGYRPPMSPTTKRQLASAIESELAMVHRKLGSGASGEALLRQGLERLKKEVGESHPDTWEMVLRIASYHKSGNEKEKAKRLIGETAEVILKRFNAKDPPDEQVWTAAQYFASSIGPGLNRNETGIHPEASKRILQAVWAVRARVPATRPTFVQSPGLKKLD